MAQDYQYVSRERRAFEQFRQWERRGRGRRMWKQPVRPEPAFEGFWNHKPLELPLVDDAAGREEGQVRFVGDVENTLPIELQAMLPRGFEVSKERTEQFLASVGNCRSPVAFEIVALGDRIVVQWVAREEDAGLLEGQLAAHFPGVAWEQDDSTLRAGVLALLDSGAWSGERLEFGLGREFMRPLASWRERQDPLVGVVGALEHVGQGEIAVVQVIFERARNRWAESIMRAVQDDGGCSGFVEDAALVSLARGKIGSPLFGVVVRAVVMGREEASLVRVAQGLRGAMGVFHGENELVPLDVEANWREHVRDLVSRRSRRSGMLLNSEELSGLAHLPGSAVVSKKLSRVKGKTKAAPAVVTISARDAASAIVTTGTQRPLFLGENWDGGEARIVQLGPDQRVRHMHVVGVQGTGKSTFLRNLILQDIEAGEGVALLDPHGDLVESVLAAMPEERFEDVVFFNPADEVCPIGFNILAARSTQEKTVLESDLVSVFKRLSTSWGDQMSSVLGNAIAAFLESERGGTLVDLRRFLVEAKFRGEFLKGVRDPEVVYYWKEQFPLLRGNPQASLLTRLDSFLRPKPIRYMVAQRESRLDLGDVMERGKIFLAKLSVGAIGDENAYLLGSLLVSKLHQLVMGRQEQAEATRRHFWLYADEFHHFVTASMASILSGARKYRLGLVLAHQELLQIQSRDAAVASAVMSNPYTRVCFCLGPEDARKLSNDFPSFDEQDLRNLGRGEALVRVERSEFDFNLRVPEKPVLRRPVPAEGGAERRERLVALSRAKYGRPREEVERLLAEAWGHAPPAERPSSPVPKASEKVERTDAKKPQGDQRTLQEALKALGEEAGWLVSLEKVVNEGQGKVDVCFKKKGRAVACEICETSPVPWELGNLEKCLAAGFDVVVVFCRNEEKLARLREGAVGVVGAEAEVRVVFARSVSDVGEVLKQEAPAVEEGTVAGYAVREEVAAPPAAETAKAPAEEDAGEGKFLERLCELFVVHGRDKVVARLLEEEGFERAGGKRVTPVEVRRLLETGKPNGRVRDGLWRETKCVLESAAPSKPPTHLFAGLVTCHCGEKLYVRSTSPAYVCRRKGCGQKFALEKPEQVFLERLRVWLTDGGEGDGAWIRGRLEAVREGIRELPPVGELTARWAELPFEVKRRLVETITDKMVVTDECVTISLLKSDK